MDNNMFGNTQENEFDNNPSMQETQDGQQTSVNAADTQTENAEVQMGQTEQYYSGSTPQYSGDAGNTGNPYTYESISSQNNQNTYSYGDQSSQNNQNVYSYNGANSQNTYAYNNQNTYGSQDAQNAQNPYSYGYQNNQNAQNTQNQYSYTGQNPSYTPAYGQNNNGYQGYRPELEEPVKMGDWLLLQCLLSFIPCVGLVLAIVWAFSKTEKQSKVNFCKAYLIVFLAQLAFAFIIILIYGSVFLAFLD